MSRISTMNSRELMMVTVGMIFVIGTLVWQLVYEPAMERRATLTRNIKKKMNDTIAARQMADEIIALRQQFDRFDQRLKKGTNETAPLARMEAMADEAGIAGSVTGFSPTAPRSLGRYIETAITITMEQVSYGGLIRFCKILKMAENGPRIRRVSIEPEFDNPDLLSVQISTSFFELAP